MVGADGLDAHGLGLDLLRDVQEDVHHLGVELRAAPRCKMVRASVSVSDAPVRCPCVMSSYVSTTARMRAPAESACPGVGPGSRCRQSARGGCGSAYYGLVVVQRHEGLRAQHRVALVAGQFFRGELAHGLCS